jgi:3-hydroxyisobutyrate dehydrogenase-like beta-hydroxyacid dehydrogenase
MLALAFGCTVLLELFRSGHEFDFRAESSALSSNGHVIDCLTLPHPCGQVAEAVRGKGALFLEAPVSGSKGPAEQGQLIFLTAGESLAASAGCQIG